MEKKSRLAYPLGIKTQNEDVISMDVDIRPICGSRTYYYGEVGIRGVLSNEILADKITVLSGMKMFRRLKDFVDVYALTRCVRVVTTDIFEIISKKHHELGDFTELFTRRDDVEHAYNKLRGVEGKPPFDEIYPYLIKFVRPFAEKDKTPRIWNSSDMVWGDASRQS